MIPIEKYHTYSLPIGKILVDRQWNCRREFDLSSVDDLANSIREVGLESPVVVQPFSQGAFEYRLLAGFRRLTACKQWLGWDEIPAQIRHGLTEEQARLINFTENLERSNLSPVEEAVWLAEHYHGRSDREVAKLVGRNSKWVGQRRVIARMPPEVQTHIDAGKLNMADVDGLRKCNPDEVIRVANLMLRAKREKNPMLLAATRKNRKTQAKRSKADIGRMIERLMEEGHGGLATKALAWSAGWIRDEELLNEILLDKNGSARVIKSEESSHESLS